MFREGPRHPSADGLGHRLVLGRDGDELAALQRAAAVRSLPGRPGLTDMTVEGLPSTFMALATGGGDGELKLQLVEAAAAVAGGDGDVAVRDAVADANDHMHTVTRTIRVCK